MRKLLATDLNGNLINIWLLLLRVLVACFMFTHGLPKFFKLMEGGEIKFGDPIGIGPGASLVLTVFAEVICSTFVLIGLATRFAVIPLIVTMLVAAIIAHAEDPFRDKEMAFLYLFVYITLMILGSGKYSVDYLLNKKFPKK